MSSPVRIETLLWSDEVVDKLWKKHHVHSWEVEEAILDDPKVVLKKMRHWKHGERWVGEGTTASGKSLKVFINPWQGEEGVWICITAWEVKK